MAKLIKVIIGLLCGISILLCMLTSLPATLADSSPSTTGLKRPMGINVLLWPFDQWPARFAKVKQLGVQQICIDWEWRLGEQQRGQYNWLVLDQLVKLASEQRLEILPVVHYAPPWALPSHKTKDTIYELAPIAAYHQDYANFVRASIQRYGPNGSAVDELAITPIRHWQIWNEPNVASFWGPKPDALAFANLAYCVHQTTKDLRAPNGVQLVHAGLAKADYLFLYGVYNWRQLATSSVSTARLTCLDNTVDYGATFEIMAINQYS